MGVSVAKTITVDVGVEAAKHEDPVGHVAREALRFTITNAACGGKRDHNCGDKVEKRLLWLIV